MSPDLSQIVSAFPDFGAYGLLAAGAGVSVASDGIDGLAYFAGGIGGGILGAYMADSSIKFFNTESNDNSQPFHDPIWEQLRDNAIAENDINMRTSLNGIDGNAPVYKGIPKPGMGGAFEVANWTGKIVNGFEKYNEYSSKLYQLRLTVDCGKPFDYTFSCDLYYPHGNMRVNEGIDLQWPGRKFITGKTTGLNCPPIE